MSYSAHASARAAQRKIPPSIVSAIYSYGRPYHSRGAVGLKFDRSALALAHDDLAAHEARHLRRFLGTFIIVGHAEQIITVARQTRRHRR